MEGKNFRVTFEHDNSHYSVELLNLENTSGHDDSLSFESDLRVLKDGEVIWDGSASDDGWGGPTNIGDSLSKDFHEQLQKEEEIGEVTKSKFFYTHTIVGHTIKHELKLSDMIAFMAEIALESGEDREEYDEYDFFDYLQPA